MTPLPIHDRAGNVLVDLRFVAEDERRPAPASLVVVTHADAALMIFDSWRKEWELPGGTREPGETPRQAAIRELHEETGIHTTALSFAAVAEFDLRNPDRHELLAIYRTHLDEPPPLIVNDEALAFRWWPPVTSPSDDMNPLDAEIARRVVNRSA
jgi:8-oxo-dGTP pyrophosphatase MutT (NUDIX family)